MGGSMTKVLPGLYIGGFDNSNDTEELIANCISHIVVVQNAKYEIEKSFSGQYLQIVMQEGDEWSLFRRVAESNDFIHQARTESGNVLVCSDSGMSANVTIVAAYLMSLYGLTRTSALGVVRGLRHAANPIPSLLVQLDLFDDPISSSVSDLKLTEYGHTRLEQSPSKPTLVTSGSEHQRLLNKFGQWNRLEEDMHLIEDALGSHKSLADSDIVSFEENNPISPEKMDGDSSMEQPSSPVPLAVKSAKWTPPRTPPSTPISSSYPRRQPLRIPLETVREIGRLSAPIHGDVPEEDTPTGNPELDIFTLDPMDDPSAGPSAADPMAWTVHTGHLRDPNDPDLSVDEVGVELAADDRADDDDDDDDVPGAIPMPVSDNRFSVAHSHRQRMAASYQPQSSSVATRSIRNRDARAGVAHSIAPQRLFPPI